MSDAATPQTVSLKFASLVSLSIEHWRLSRTLGEGAAPAIRHALRKIDDVIRECEMETMSLDGRQFDPGLAARVVEAIDDPTLLPGRAIIDETLSPVVLWRGRVVRSADVVTRNGK